MSFLSEKAAVFIDGDYILHSSKNSGVDLDFVKLQNLLVSKFGQQIQISFFGEVKDQTLLLLLIRLGYTVKFPESKNSADSTLMVKAVSLSKDYDTAVLISGDSVFISLIKNLKEQGKKVVIISSKDVTSSKIIEYSDEFIDLKEFLSRPIEHNSKPTHNNEHPNIKVLITRMDDAFSRKDYAEVIHSSASLFETMAKDIVNISSIQNQSLKSFFDRYRKDSGLPSEILDYILGVYELRNVTPLAGHGSTETPQINKGQAFFLCEMTKAFVNIEYGLRSTK
jgi:uncharacterized LabA/DUF88 family protein